MYCNAACKKKHRHKHKKACERRVAELHDEKLFKQPPPKEEEDCPICMIRLPNLGSGTAYMQCCGKIICSGCIHAFQSRAANAGRLKEDNICPFCRTPMPNSVEELIKQFEKRVVLNDADAIYSMGSYYDRGQFGLPQNQAKKLELWHRAAELGNAEAHSSIGCSYRDGRGVEVNEKMATHYYELAAMGGSSIARFNLGAYEGNAGNVDRALKHFMIAARNGDAISLKSIKGMYKNGDVTKDDYASALQYYQAYLDEIKSDQRDEAAASNGRYKYYESAV